MAASRQSRTRIRQALDRMVAASEQLGLYEAEDAALSQLVAQRLAQRHQAVEFDSDTDSVVVVDPHGELP